MASRLAEELQIAQAFAPVDMSSAANDGDWFDMTNYRSVLVVLHTAVGTAGDDATLTMEQATSAAGAGAKALTFTRINVKQATSLPTVAQYTEVTQTAAATYTEATAAEKQTLWVLQIDDEDLDVDNQFSHIRARVADVGTNAQLGSCIYIGAKARYNNPLPSSIA